MKKMSPVQEKAAKETTGMDTAHGQGRGKGEGNDLRRGILTKIKRDPYNQELEMHPDPKFYSQDSWVALNELIMLTKSNVGHFLCSPLHSKKESKNCKLIQIVMLRALLRF